METASFKFTVDMPIMTTRPMDKVPRVAPNRCLSSCGGKEGGECEWGTALGMEAQSGARSLLQGHPAQLPSRPQGNPDPDLQARAAQAGRAAALWGVESWTVMAGGTQWRSATEAGAPDGGDWAVRSMQAGAPGPRGPRWCQRLVSTTPIPPELLPPHGRQPS